MIRSGREKDFVLNLGRFLSGVVSYLAFDENWKPFSPKAYFLYFFSLLIKKK
jgi:type II secretory pathway component PulM